MMEATRQTISGAEKTLRHLDTRPNVNAPLFRVHFLHSFFVHRLTAGHSDDTGRDLREAVLMAS
jgi:hypothetical protein